ncbi:unnamed protein product, partial [Tetraodon nigroviridis]
SRRAESLAEITKRFLRLLQESEDGILDLKEASYQDPGCGTKKTNL